MPTVAPNNFFSQRRSITEIKQELLLPFFDVWCCMQVNRIKEQTIQGIFYADLHAESKQDAVPDTNTTLLKSILSRPELNQQAHSFYYSQYKEVLEQVQQQLSGCAYCAELQNPPKSLAAPEIKVLPGELAGAGHASLVFADPFASVLAHKVAKKALLEWRSDLFMLISPDNLTKTMAGKKQPEILARLFAEQLPQVQRFCRLEKDKGKRQQFILEQFECVLQSKGYASLLYKINLPKCEQAAFYLLFASPDLKVYRGLKEYMMAYSVSREDGVPEWAAHKFVQAQFSLFGQEPAFTIVNLIKRLTDKAGQYKYKSVEKIYELDNPGTAYCLANYLAAFEQMQREGLVEFLNASTRQTTKRPTDTSLVKFKS
ncbi:hypothetical protein [Pontibacter mangrovi]|uniref:Three-Cys-motif partner protein TcmP n=1 Tax=Pontibacter mangrovi TaxID=2589816 RepID=A0A501W5E2_9BACT|nr:hypothetical protein [Pontibacter mangrovi]TPE42471.1 hypothetical protein FJM65_17855 [Pontibacter mangrovi]